MLESLEPRIAPAAFVTYTDVDGDLVKITASKGPLAAADLTFVGGGTGGQLARLDLNDAGFNGADITFTVTKAATGDGLAAVGFVESELDLGTVTVKGDLGRIYAGDDAYGSPGLKALIARSLGRYGLATQGGTGELTSYVSGALGSLTVTGDVKEATLTVIGGAAGTIGTVTIGGSLLGGAADSSGAIFTGGDVGPVKVGGDLRGGTGSQSGGIFTGGKLASVTVGGSIVGSAGPHSGAIESTGDLGTVKVGRDVKGGAGESSGRVSSEARLGGVMIGGSLRGGAGLESGHIHAAGKIELVTIGRDLIGGDGDNSGLIQGGETLNRVTIGGSILGGGRAGSGSCGSIWILDGIGTIRIGGDLRGSAGDLSGWIESSGRIGNISIGGSILGGSGVSSGGVLTNGLGQIHIAGDVIGHGNYSGVVDSYGSVGAVKIGGALLGGSGGRSGVIECDSGDLGPVRIGGDVLGGGGENAGRILSTGKIASVTIGGSLIGGAGQHTGEIFATGNLGAVKIGGDLQGSSIGPNDGSLDRTGYIQGARIASVTIGGSVSTGFDTSGVGVLTKNGSIRAVHDLGPIIVKGDLRGSAPGLSVIISARGQLTPTATTDLAIARVIVVGDVENAIIRAGFGVDNSNRQGTNNNAQIGAVVVGGDWITSSITAGVRDANGDGFGNLDDVLIPTTAVDAIISRIASITIGAEVIGSNTVGDNYGFTAEQIGSFKSLGYAAPLTPAKDARLVLTPLTGDIAIREV